MTGATAATGKGEHVPLHVLFLEDVPDDAALIKAELARAGYTVRSEVVDTQEAFVARLRPGLDVILSDHGLPQLDALQALDLVKQSGLDVPFIIVSGVIEEETAVEAMRRGAADYLLKDRLTRLGTSVRQALHEKQLREDQERAAEALRQSEAQYRLLAEHATDVICRVGMDGTVLYASPSLRTLLGYAPEELVGRNAFDFVVPGDAVHLRNGLAALRNRPVQDLHVHELATCQALRKDGTAVWVETNSRLVEEGAAGREIVTVLRDVSERMWAHEALAASQRRLVQVQEEERRALALELHDEVGQVLTALALSLDAAVQMPARAGEIVDGARSLVRQLQADVRNLSLDLRPSMLDDLGLVPALEWLFGRVEERLGISVTRRLPVALPLLSADVATAAYRIVQEALTNVAKHAGAPGAEVQVGVAGRSVTIEVADAGCGLDPEYGRTGGIGLRGMTERARYAGGTLTVEDRPGGGVVVSARLPVAE